MDRFGGTFGEHGDAFDDAEPREFEDAPSAIDAAPLAPPSPVGQDERRMQVRAYNHWASLLGEGNFPRICDLNPETLGDFGPYGILLEFSGKRGIDDPAIRFLGAKLAEECGGEASFRRLSDVPGRSLLSRITDHYLQILANQAPIGFEAEFTNHHGATVLYRGILLPWSSDGEAIDFIFGVINWKEAADAATADALLAAIDAGFESEPGDEENDVDRMLDLTGFAMAAGDNRGGTELPVPAFGPPAMEETQRTNERSQGVDDQGDEADASSPEWGAGFSGFGDDDTVYSVDYGAQGLEDGEADEDFDGVVDPLSDDSATLGLASLVSRSGRVKQSVILPGYGAVAGDAGPAAPLAVPQGYEPDAAPAPLVRAPVYAPAIAEVQAAKTEPVLDLDVEMIELDSEEPGAIFAEDTGDGLYDCLAEARELAQTARSSEDRGRKALYQAVSRAYDFSIEAAANPGDFEELLTENGLTVQDRAPMTPVVKLVFGADYDKTRLTEYATVLGYAHRTGVARGTLGRVLSGAEGGLKGIVRAERQARREAEGKPATDARGIRAALARKLRKLDAVAYEDLPEDGPEFALVMIRRLPSGGLEIVGEMPEDLPLLEKAARRMLA